MHHNYCFRHKQYSYAACDAALAASDLYILTKPKVTEASHSKDFLFPNAIPYQVIKKAHVKIHVTFKIIVG